jgi:hypothetical protein
MSGDGRTDGYHSGGRADLGARQVGRTRGQIQPVEAFASTSSVNNSEGFIQLWILRGRSLISEATVAR